MKVQSAAQLIVLALLVVGVAGAASAQTQLGGVNVEEASRLAGGSTSIRAPRRKSGRSSRSIGT